MTKSKGIGRAPLGNKKALKLKDPDVRQEAFRQYCAHIESGLSKENFVFEHPQLDCCYKTMESYIKENPMEFPAIKKEIAWAKGFQKLEQVCIDSATGANKDACTASLQMIMRNKYKWDKPEAAESGKSAADEILEKINARLS